MLQIDREIFASQPTHRGLGVSLLLHVIAGAALLSVTLPATFERPHHVTTVYLPQLRSPARPRLVTLLHKAMPRPKVSVIPQPTHLSRLIEPPLVEAPRAPLAPAPVAAAPPPLREAFPLPEPTAPRPAEAATGLFESRVATVNAAEPGARVQTGLFDSAPNITAKPTRAFASGGGFGDGALAPPAHSAPRSISSIQFDAVSVARAVRRAGPGAGVHEPIEILAKPKPIYTEEARRLRIEGEVVLEVLFRASAQICVLRVVKSLGHGLDASAESAAMGIRFHPAAEDGRSVDSMATVKIEFQLAD
jgi:TonB family protein